MTAAFFRISGRSIIPGDWGDYGDILQQGMGAHLARENGRIALERTGPFIPPITFPGFGGFVLTAQARKLFEASGLTGYSFQPVEKKLIVELHWEEWDLEAPEPKQYPESGEPEDYILGQAHSPEAAAALGDLWEVLVSKAARIIKPDKPYHFGIHKEFLIDSSSWNGDDLFGSHDVGYVLFTERARDWFFGHWGEYIDFEEIRAI
jgi:hypothetical protein